jgi:methionine aminotransferase
MRRAAVRALSTLPAGAPVTPVATNYAAYILSHVEAEAARSPLRVLPAAGSFFQLVDYSGCEALSALDDLAAAQLLLEQAGVATIPLSPFYKVPPAQTLLRLCFAKREETLREGASRLRHWMG